MQSASVCQETRLPAAVKQAAPILRAHASQHALIALAAWITGRRQVLLENRSFGRIAFDLGEFRRVVSVRPEHMVKGHHRRGPIVALQEGVMKKVITGATETAIAEPVQPPVVLLGQHQKRGRMLTSRVNSPVVPRSRGERGARECRDHVHRVQPDEEAYERSREVEQVLDRVHREARPRSRVV